MLGRKPPFQTDYLNRPEKSIFSVGFINHLMDEEDQDPWKINPNQNQPRRYVLNSQDRLYCADGECGSYRESTLVRRIREDRIAELPERIQDLIDDIMLIEYADEDFLDSNEWDKLWTDIINVEQRSEAVTDKDILPPIELSDEVQFGFELGSTIDVLRSDDSHVEPLLWGILQGLLSSGAEDTSIQIMIIEEIVEQFQNRIDERRQRAESKLSIDKSYEELTKDINRKINTYLCDNDIEATASDIKITDKLIEDAINGSNEYRFEKNVDSYINNLKLSDMDDLRRQLKEDSIIVENKSKQGIKIRKVFEYMYLKSEDDKHSKDDFPFRPAIRHMLVAALKQLSNRADGGLNMHRPAVEQVNECWKLTTYGKLLSHTVFEQEDSNWIYTYAIEPYDLPVRQKRRIKELVML